MRECFDELEAIECAEFFERFGKHADSRDSEDEYEKGIFQDLDGVRDYMHCYVGILTERGLEHIVLPQHDHALEKGRVPDRPTKTGGENLEKVASDFREHFIPGNRFMPCSKKIQELKQREDFFNLTEPICEAAFLFVCNHWEYAHKGSGYHDHGPGKLYIGNGYHRFIAYKLWLLENNLFNPLRVHYVELPLHLTREGSADEFPDWR